MRYLITGGAGFIGSTIADRLLQNGAEVVSYDNFSTGFEEFVRPAMVDGKFKMVNGDILDEDRLASAMNGADFVFHFAANADVRYGTEHPGKDLQQNTIGTFRVLEAMRKNGVSKIAFSSTGSIYGEPDIFPTPEDAPFPIQTSLYGASKLAGEGLIAAYCEGFDFQAWVFRFVSILGERYTHGHIFDFYKKLMDNPDVLHVLGNGRQRKSYLYVQDCIDAILLAIDKAQAKFNVLNLGTDEFCTVNDSITSITKYLNIKPEIIYSGGERGWIGDSPFIFLDCAKIRSIGWVPKLTIQQAVIRTLQFLMDNRWILDKRV